MATAVKDRRLDLRLDADQRRAVEDAVEASGAPSISQWAISRLMEGAERDIRRARVSELDAEAFDRFKAALEEPLPEGARDLLSRKPVWE